MVTGENLALTSGWYLPSTGQQYLWFTFMGQLSPTMNYTLDPPMHFWWSSVANTVATNNNTILSSTGLTEYTEYTPFRHGTVGASGSSIYGYYWTSTEEITNNVLFANFGWTSGSNGNLHIGSDYTQTNTPLYAQSVCRVRPVFAF